MATGFVRNVGFHSGPGRHAVVMVDEAGRFCVDLITPQPRPLAPLIERSEDFASRPEADRLALEFCQQGAAPPDMRFTAAGPVSVVKP